MNFFKDLPEEREYANSMQFIDSDNFIGPDDSNAFFEYF